MNGSNRERFVSSVAIYITSFSVRWSCPHEKKTTRPKTRDGASLVTKIQYPFSRFGCMHALTNARNSTIHITKLYDTLKKAIPARTQVDKEANGRHCYQHSTALPTRTTRSICCRQPPGKQRFRRRLPRSANGSGGRVEFAASSQAPTRVPENRFLRNNGLRWRSLLVTSHVFKAREACLHHCVPPTLRP